jgi:formylglycine-generating enzyme required for sulfatase activity
MRVFFSILALWLFVRSQAWAERPSSLTNQVHLDHVLDRERDNTSETEKRLFTQLGLSHPLIGGVSAKIGVVATRWIPSGQFVIGSDAVQRGLQTNENQYEIEIPFGFFMAEAECRQSEWEAVMGSNRSRFKEANHPVEEVTWNQAMEFCKKLTELQQRTGVLTEGWEWRLPTEAEWEYATRAGTKTPRYGPVNEIAWWENNSEGKTHPVGEKTPNGWGLYDTIGNVWEWCLDRYSQKTSATVTLDMTEHYRSGANLGDIPTGAGNNMDLPLTQPRVVRGGSWDNGASDCRAARRTKVPEALHYDNLGFRPILARRL